ncbi:MAG: hypothetical protein AB7O52_13850 [Planctomycetota bacterium]
MRRDLSLLRRLEKIEKEMGYCEIKLEKAQRLRTQLHFLKLHLRGVVEAAQRYAELGKGSSSLGNRLAGYSLPEVLHLVAVERDPGLTEELREIFQAVGALPLLEEQSDFIRREVDELQRKLETFKAFTEKRLGLANERAEALVSFDVKEVGMISEISARFESTERSWNTLTEDLMNYDEALFSVNRTVDYLTSARDFILASRSQFAIDRWVESGFLIDLFKHSTVGRAKEMVEGADRNLKASLVELVCLEELLIEPDDFEHLLQPFLDALFNDLFSHTKLRETFEFLEGRLARALGLRAKLQAKRDDVFSRQLAEEETRGRLFNEIGRERKKLSLA